MSPSTGEDVQSPGTANIEAKEDEQMVFMKVAQAGQTVSQNLPSTTSFETGQLYVSCNSSSVH